MYTYIIQNNHKSPTKKYTQTIDNSKWNSKKCSSNLKEGRKNKNSHMKNERNKKQKIRCKT